MGPICHIRHEQIFVTLGCVIAGCNCIPSVAISGLFSFSVFLLSAICNKTFPKTPSFFSKTLKKMQEVKIEKVENDAENITKTKFGGIIFCLTHTSSKHKEEIF